MGKAHNRRSIGMILIFWADFMGGLLSRDKVG
jgi:hypothetical protein